MSFRASDLDSGMAQLSGAEGLDSLREFFTVASMLSANVNADVRNRDNDTCRNRRHRRILTFILHLSPRFVLNLCR